MADMDTMPGGMNKVRACTALEDRFVGIFSANESHTSCIMGFYGPRPTLVTRDIIHSILVQRECLMWWNLETIPSIVCLAYRL